MRIVDHEESIDNGDTLSVSLKIENKRVAPFYFEWPLVFYLIDSEGTIKLQQTLDVDIRKWLPGIHTIIANILIPFDVSSNTYNIKLAINEPETDAPGVMFANTGKDEQGRYLVSRLKVN